MTSSEGWAAHAQQEAVTSEAWLSERTSGKKLAAAGVRKPAPFAERSNLVDADMYPADHHLARKPGTPTSKVGSYKGSFDPAVYAANAAAVAELRLRHKGKLSVGENSILAHK